MAREIRRSDPAVRTFNVVPSDSAPLANARWLYAKTAGTLVYKDQFDADTKSWPHPAMTIIPLGPTYVLTASTGTYVAAV